MGPLRHWIGPLRSWEGTSYTRGRQTVGHAPFGGKGALRWCNEGLWVNLHILTIYNYLAKRNMVTLLPGEITSSLIAGYPKKKNSFVVQAGMQIV